MIFGDHSRSTACTSAVFRLSGQHAEQQSRRGSRAGPRPRARAMTLLNVGGSGFSAMASTSANSRRQAELEGRREEPGFHADPTAARRRGPLQGAASDSQLASRRAGLARRAPPR